MDELITVVIPVYNVEKYLNRCIESVINQTYKNLEIILVDDGATDNCPSICDEYAKKDSRIKVIHKKNGGLSDARNVAIDVAKGAYIGFVDSDDYIALDMFEKLYNAINEYEADISVCLHYVEKGKALSIEVPPMDEVKVMGRDEAEKLLLEDKFVKNYAWDKLYKATLFEGVRYPVGRNYEDIATTYLLFEKADKVCRIPEYLYSYQMRDDSISANASDEKWHKNCKAIIQGNMERYLYYTDKDKKDFADMAMSKLVVYIYTFIMFSYKLDKPETCREYQQFLRDNKGSIKVNKYISQKDKNLIDTYTASELKCKVYFRLRSKRKIFNKFKKVINRTKRLVKKPQCKCDFKLAQGKNKRLVLFELPCFDNLGDHAIAYADKLFLERFIEKNPEYQLFVIDGWDVPNAVEGLKSCVQASDIMLCQGGGNMGNLYEFAEVMRHKVLKAFPDNKIIIFPQTLYFTKDAEGQVAYKKYRKIYNTPKQLTIFARDAHTYELMKDFCNADIVKMTDMVASVDASEYASDNREGMVLCLRSDVESSLDAEGKKYLYSLCRKYSDKVLVTDTVTRTEISQNTRMAALESKWRTFGKARLVVTDRLHGMIFCLITKTPCIVLGNNHHKVRETYNTLAKCEYLYFCNGKEEVEAAINKALAAPVPKVKTDFSENYLKIEQIIKGC